MVSIKAAVMVITLLTFCLLATETSAVSYECCRRYMRPEARLRFHAIRGYSIQTRKAMCPINAIIFHMKRGLACTDPSLPWVMDYIIRLRNEAQKIHDKNH